MEPDRNDAAFRRFLERATEDPPAGGHLVELAAGQGGGHHRRAASTRTRGAILAAAAVAVVVGGIVALRPANDGVTIEPAAPGGQAWPQLTGASTVTTGAVPPTLDPTAAIGAPATTVVGVGQVPAPPDGPPGSDPSVTVPDPGATLAPGPASARTSPGPGPSATSSSTRLSLGLDMVPVGAVDGAEVVPAAGPLLAVERVGSGTIEAVPGGGRRFLPGGQQRTDHAVVTRVGSDVGALLAPRGRATLVLVPLVDVDQRTTGTGRNIHTWFEIVSRDGPDDLVTGLQLQIDPEIGPYFGGAVNGTGFIHVLGAQDLDELGAGRPVTVSLEWTATTGRLVLNGRTLTELELAPRSIEWTASARLSIGGSASWGGGYFAARDDALQTFELTAAP